jgi:2-polyprenyl-3-methyl-5-hydroxy-6-metoxy-1,4-benzoquinol methylase
MSWESTAKDWETLGRTDPFWAVISNDVYHRSNLSAERLDAFLKTGDEHVDEVWRICRRVFGEHFAPRRALDFGCGVGRVALPLSRRIETVVAVDVADSMLSIARELLHDRFVTNVDVVKSDRTLSSIGGPFDFVHSVLVLQHIPQTRGLWLIGRLIELCADGGVVVLHVLYHNPFARSRLMRGWHGILHPFRRWVGRPPHIQMNAYPLDRVMEAVQAAGARSVHVELTDHGGHLGAMLFFRKGATGGR